MAFLRAVELLGPASIHAIKQAAAATLAPPRERAGEFDALFRAHFFGETQALAARRADAQSEPRDTDCSAAAEAIDGEERTGEAASFAELLQERAFGAGDRGDALRLLASSVAGALPARRAFRHRASRRRGVPDLRRSLREVVRHEGDIVTPVTLVRDMRRRNVLLLIDISGSMKAHTQDYLRAAHTITHAARRVETFAFGTRLSRITRALAARHMQTALDAVSAAVDDWDGGTRLGESLAALLCVPRFASFARGAVVIVLSDGLERGDTGEFVKAVRRLSRLAWRLSWATPLAADPRFRPESAALRSALPHLDDLADGSSIESLSRLILRFRERATATERAWLRAGVG